MEFEKCKYEYSCGYDLCVPEFCKEYTPVPMTNGDRIRSMTDEELAEFILDKRENGTCFNNKCYYYDPNKGCDDCTLEWLKQPVR